MPAGLVPLVIFLVLGAGPARADDVTIEVSPSQRVTVTGRAPSLQTVVKDICFRAGVDVLFYDATDRPFGGTYRDLPLATLLQRLLREESFMVETAGGGVAPERLTVLRVLGDPAVASARRARGGGHHATFQVPPVLLDTAFGSAASDSTDRDAALATLAARISGDPTQLQGFLSTDSRLIAEAIRRYKGVEAPLRELQKRYPDPRIATKIDEIVAALAAPTTAALPR